MASVRHPMLAALVAPQEDEQQPDADHRRRAQRARCGEDQRSVVTGVRIVGWTGATRDRRTTPCAPPRRRRRRDAGRPRGIRLREILRDATRRPEQREAGRVSNAIASRTRSVVEARRSRQLGDRRALQVRKCQAAASWGASRPSSARLRARASDSVPCAARLTSTTS